MWLVESPAHGGGLVQIVPRPSSVEPLLEKKEELADCLPTDGRDAGELAADDLYHRFMCRLSLCVSRSA